MGDGTFSRELNAADLRLLSGPPIDKREGKVSRERETISSIERARDRPKHAKEAFLRTRAGDAHHAEEYTRVHGVVRDSEGGSKMG